MRWKQQKGTLLLAALLVGVLAAAFWCSSRPQEDTPLPQTITQEEAPKQQASGQEETQTAGEIKTIPADSAADSPPQELPSSPEPTASSPVESPAEQPASPASDEQPAPEDSEETCTLSISCAAIFNHLDWCDPEKVELIPESGWILPATQAAFTEGESVFDVLKRVCREQGIHLEYAQTPGYGSMYIEGMANLYEFDAGSLSGWMYQVNGWFPNYSCSEYQLHPGDVIGWVYTCELGADVGGGEAAK